jgi:hypothetical protein
LYVFGQRVVGRAGGTNEQILLRWSATALPIAVTATVVKTAETAATTNQAAPAAISESVLWSFGATGDGLFPVAGLVNDERGNLDGTQLGGANVLCGGPGHEIVGCGTVFELSLP